MDGLVALVNSKDFIRNIGAAKTDSVETPKRTQKYYHKNTIRRPVLQDKSGESSNLQTKPAATFGELLKLDKTFGKLEEIILKQADQPEAEPTAIFLDNNQPASPSDNFEVKECIIGEAFALSSGYESVELLSSALHPRQLSTSNRRVLPSRRTWVFKKHRVAKPQGHEFTFNDANSSLSQTDHPLSTAKKSLRLLSDIPPTDLQATQRKNKENLPHIDFPPTQTLQMVRKLSQHKQQTVSSKSSNQTAPKNYEVDVLRYDSSQSLKDDQQIESIKFKPIVTVLQDQQVLPRLPKSPEKPVFDVKPIKPAGIQVEMIKLSVESPSDIPVVATIVSRHLLDPPKLQSQSLDKQPSSTSPPILDFEPVDIPQSAVPDDNNLALIEPLTELQGPPQLEPARRLLCDQPEPRIKEEPDEDLNDALQRRASGKFGSIRFKSHFRSSSFHNSASKAPASPPRYGRLM